MSESDKKKPNRRDFILTATTAAGAVGVGAAVWPLSLIHISEPTRRRGISYAVFCLKKKKKQ